MTEFELKVVWGHGPGGRELSFVTTPGWGHHPRLGRVRSVKIEGVKVMTHLSGPGAGNRDRGLSHHFRFPQR